MYATPSSSRRWSSAASPIASDGTSERPSPRKPRLDGRDDALDRLERHRALDARALEAAQELRAIERLTAAVALDDPQHRLLEALERREARVAVEALATAADGLAGVAHARLQHTRLAFAAAGADHLPAARSGVVSPRRTPDTVAAGIGRSRTGSTRRVRRASGSAREAALAHARSEVPRPASRSSAAAPPSASTGRGTSSACAGPRFSQQARDRAADADGGGAPAMGSRGPAARAVLPVRFAVAPASRRIASMRLRAHAGVVAVDVARQRAASACR